MTTRDLVGRVLMSLSAAITTAVPLMVDLSPSHVLNATWPAHARVHAVWLLATGAMIGAYSLYLIWMQKDARGLSQARVLLTIVPAGFFVASATTTLYGGELIDPRTVDIMPHHDELFGIPLNSLTFAIALVLLWVGAALVPKEPTT